MKETPPTSAERPEIGALAARAPERRAGGRVLVIDDDVAVGMVLSRAMARLGFAAGVAADGPKGIALFNSDPSSFVLVLLDFKLPGMTSLEVHRLLRAARPELPIVLMSGYNQDEAMNNSNGLDLAGFLHKPFTMDTLSQALRSALTS
jgi:DNA-binding response OmpR family regulator